MNACFRQDQLAHAVVLEAHHRVGVLLNRAEGFLRLLPTPPAFERERQRGAHQHEGVLFPRHLDDHRRGPGTRPAAEADAHDHQGDAFHAGP